MHPSSSIPCKFFAMGVCRNGDRCAFSHDISYIKPELSWQHQQQLFRYPQNQGQKSYIRHNNAISSVYQHETFPAYSQSNRRYVDSGVLNENFSSAYIDSHQGTSAAFHPSFYPDKRLLTWRAPHLRKQQPLKKSLEVDTNSGITCESHSETKSKLSSSHHDSLKPSTKSISSAEKPVPASVPRSNDSPKNVIYIPDDWYSDVNSLSKDDLEQFEADSFDLEKVPEVPPPRHLC